MSDAAKRQVIADISGGRNGFDPPWAIKDTECVDHVNCDFYKTRFANKRGGMAAVSTTFLSGGPFTGTVSSLFRHVPGTDQSAAELWGIDDAATNVIGRMAAATTFTAPTVKDAPTGNGWDWTATTINGLLVLAYKSAQGRLHCWDGSTVRRMGLAATAAPTAADGGGGGTYAAVLRYYRMRSTVQVAGVTVRRSEPSPSVSFTPDASHANATITKAAAINEGETHWEAEASTDNITFYRIATVVIGTATYADSALTTTYASNTLSALTGVYTLFGACKFIAADQNRILAFADYTSANKQSRLYISAVIGSSDIGDAERVDTSAINYYIDFDESDSGVPTGLAGPVLGAFFVFKDRRVWMLTPTGVVTNPYRQDNISKDIGALSHYAIARGEDTDGNSALYWMSHRGPYRWTVKNGMEYIGRNVEDYVLTDTMINLSASKSVARVLYYPDKRQVRYWWATGSSNDCNQGFIYDVVTGGWSRIPAAELMSNIRCAVMFSNTLGATMSLDLKPYVGETGAVNTLSKCDSGTDDRGTPFKSYVLTKAYEVGGAGYMGDVADAMLVAKAATGVTITETIIPDFGAVTGPTGSADLTPSNLGEARVIRRVDGSFTGNASFYQYQIGDAVSIANNWTLERLAVPVNRNQARTN